MPSFASFVFGEFEVTTVVLAFWFVVLKKLGGLSYFAGAEKKDERVLVPDLGSLTSIYDRCVWRSVDF